MLDIIRQIFSDMRAHRLRTFLALFGIIWGTAAVVILMAMGDAFYSVNKTNLSAIAENNIYVLPGVTSLPYQGLGLRRSIQIKSDDISKIAAHVPGIQAISPVMMHPENISYHDIVLGKMLTGVAPSYQKQMIQVAPGGRFIDALDVKTSAPSVFLGYKLSQALFKDANPLGKTVYINHYPMHVVGVMSTESEGTMLNNANAADSAFISYSAYELFSGKQNLNFFIITPKANADRDALIKSLRQYMGKHFHFSEKDLSALNIPDTQQFTDFIKWFFIGIQLFLGFCGLLTLAVGGIGIANTLFLIVSERTSEIGLRMALGARDYHILWHVLIEAILLVFIGGALGLLIATGIIAALQHAPLPHGLGVPTLDLNTFLLTFSTLLVIALAAGFFPARRAARLQPVTALAF